MSGTMPEEAAASVMSLGAHDFIDKSKPARLVPVVERELRQVRLRREKRDAEESLRRLTYRDALTGLPNGRMLVERIDEHLNLRPTGGPPSSVCGRAGTVHRHVNDERDRRADRGWWQEALRQQGPERA